MDKYLKAIKQNVCSICVDSNEKGGCTLNEKETCAVELYLSQIIEIVNSLETDDKKEYFSKLYDVVCTKCREKEEGRCYLREDANCSLDRYFPIIVDVIRKVNKGVI